MKNPCSVKNIDDDKFSIDVNESLQNKVSVSELEDGKYLIDLASTIPNSNGKKK